MPRDQFADGRDEVARDLHHGVAGVLERTLVLVDGLVLGLALIVGKDALDALLIPTGRKLVVAHLVLLCR
jgi:hypothetical protein